MPAKNTIASAITDWFLDSIFRTWWFDPALSTLTFTVCIHVYSVLEYKEEEAQQQKDDGDQLTTTVVLRPPLHSLADCRMGPLQRAFVAYWIGVGLWVSIIPPAANEIADGWPNNDNLSSGLLFLLLEVVTGIVAYDAIFWGIHWSLHTIPWLQPLHRTHHQHQYTSTTAGSIVRARDVLHHSLVDGTLQVLVNIVVQRTTVWGSVKTRCARALHNIVVIWMLTESHTTVRSARVWRRWFRGVREHARHHHHHAGGHHRAQRYQQFFAYLDDGLELWRKKRSNSHLERKVAE